MKRILFGVWIVAFCLRCVYIWQISGAPFFNLRIGDAEAYHLWARRIADGDWLGQGVFYQAPLYPYFLAVLYQILGDSPTTVRLVQAFIGATSCTLLAAAGMSLFGRLGTIAGLALAVYPEAIFLDGLLEKSALVTFFTAALLALLATPLASMTITRWLVVGIVLDLLALTRENALILVVPVVLAIAFGRRVVDGRPRVKAGPVRDVVAFLTGCAVVLLPVALRNLAVGGEFHLTTSQVGPNFYIGNHPGADGTYEALVRGHGSAADEREDAARLAEEALGRRLSPGEVSRFWLGRSFDYIRSQPFDWLKLLARKTALTFNAAEIADTESRVVYAERSSLLRVLSPFSFGAVFAMAALGAWLTAPAWRHIWFLYAIAAAYALSVVLFHVFARYRFPIVPALMLFAAGGVSGVLAPGRRRHTPTLTIAVAIAALAFATAHLPVESAENVRAYAATHYFDIAAILARTPEQRDEAVAYFERALDASPGFPPARSGLATVLASMGRLEEAIPHFRAALEASPENADARYNFGLTLAAAGHPEEASRQLSVALELRPKGRRHSRGARENARHVEPPRSRGVALRARARSAARQRDGARGAGCGPRTTGSSGRRSRPVPAGTDVGPAERRGAQQPGGTLANQGRIAEALPHFERAVALNPGDENARKNLERAHQMLKK